MTQIEINEIQKLAGIIVESNTDNVSINETVSLEKLYFEQAEHLTAANNACVSYLEIQKELEAILASNISDTALDPETSKAVGENMDIIDIAKASLKKQIAKIRF